MATAFLAAKRSKDPSTQVGACVVNQDNRIVGIGYNGMPNHCNDDELPWSKTAESKLENKYLYGKKSVQSGSRSSDENYQFFIIQKINADIKLWHFVIALTKSFCIFFNIDTGLCSISTFVWGKSLGVRWGEKN
jgi:hypothetical protein